ncbi:unnamed protein product [Sphagnum compactum]
MDHAIHVCISTHARVFVLVILILILVVCPWSVHCGRVIWPATPASTTTDHSSFILLVNREKNVGGAGMNSNHSFNLAERLLSSASRGIQKALKFLLETTRGGGAVRRPPSASIIIPPDFDHLEVNYRTATKKSEAAAAAAVTSIGTLSKGSTAGSHDESAPGANGSTFDRTARPQVNYSFTSRRKNNYPVAAAGRSKFALNSQLAKGTIGPGSGTPSPDHNSIPVKMKGRWH